MGLFRETLLTFDLDVGVVEENLGEVEVVAELLQSSLGTKNKNKDIQWEILKACSSEMNNSDLTELVSL